MESVVPRLQRSCCGETESEERSQRAYGRLTTALANILRSPSRDLTMLVRVRRAAGREAGAELDAKHIEEWVGADVWKEMVLKAMQGLRYIHEHEDNPWVLLKVFMSMRITLGSSQRWNIAYLTSS